MSACSAVSWREEVLLHDGSKLILERSHTRGGRHEIGQKPSITEHKISFTLPSAHEIITWKSTYGSDTNDLDLMLNALDVINGVPYIVTSTTTCMSYNKWGRPNPPYVLFKYDDKTWQRIPLEEFPVEFKEANVVIGISIYDRLLETHSGIVSAEEVKRINTKDDNGVGRYLRLFVREPIKNEVTVGCSKFE